MKQQQTFIIYQKNCSNVVVDIFDYKFPISLWSIALQSKVHVCTCVCIWGREREGVELVCLNAAALYYNFTFLFWNLIRLETAKEFALLHFMFLVWLLFSPSHLTPVMSSQSQALFNIYIQLH